MRRLATLIIDADADFVMAAGRFLSDFSACEIVGHAATGYEGMVAARRLRPELVLVELALPDIDGLELAARLRQLAPPPAMIGVSALTRARFGRRSGDEVLDRYIGKQEFSAAVPRVVDRLIAARDARMLRNAA